MILSWIRKYLAVRSSKKLIRTVKSVLKKKGEFLAPREAEHAEIRIDGCERSIEKGSLYEIRTSTKALRLFFENNLSAHVKSRTRQNVEAIAVAVLLALAVRAFVFQPFKIPSGSMLPTLLVGDHILINKYLYGTRIPFTNIVVFPFSEISRGDVVVFKLGEDAEKSRKGAFYIKRAIGVAGDEIDISERTVFINGRPIPQTYVGDYESEDGGAALAADMYRQTMSGREFDVMYKKGMSSTSTGTMNFPLVVPEDRIFVMGDNRDNSYDSRFWGFVPVENVYGKAFVIHWSWNRAEGDITKMVRWKRIFSTIE